MSVARRGPVLAYSHPGTLPAVSAGVAVRPELVEGRIGLERLLAAHGFMLERGTHAVTGRPVLRLVNRTTGHAPARVPAALVAALAASVASAQYPTLASA